MALDPRITPAMWALWTDRPVSSWRLGGIIANKPHYHNTVLANLRSWPWSYSVRYALDTKQGPADKARAIDWTMSSADMRKYTKRLIDAADRNDPRMRGVREFYGTLNGSTVVGRIRDNDTGEFRESTANSSHLWHIHLAVWAAYCASVAVLSGITSVLHGESLEAWLKRLGGGYVASASRVAEPTLREGDSGSGVELLQSNLNEALGLDLAEDGRYGPNTTGGVKLLQRRAGITEDGIYGPDSAGALADLLEDDMDPNDRIPFPNWAQERWDAGPDILVRTTLASGYAHSREAKERVKALQSTLASHGALLEKLIAAQSGLTAEEIRTAVASGVADSLPDVAQLAAEVVAAVVEDLGDELDAAVLGPVVEGALRRVLGGLDEGE